MTTREQWNAMTPDQQYHYVQYLESIVDTEYPYDTAQGIFQNRLAEPPLDECDTVKFETL